MNYLKGHPLAMLPTKVTEIFELLQDRENGIKAALEDVKTKEGEGLVVSNGIARIDIYGAISKRMNMAQKMSGGVSVELLQNDIKKALADDSVDGILLNIDSPGGSVHGIKDISDMINSAEKPIVAYTDGLMASAAMWIGSAADVVVASETSTVGSIGVVTVHTDTSVADEKYGVKRTVLTAGKYKAMGNSTEPLGDEAREVIQAQLDEFYGIFVESVAGYRGKTVEAILEAADGKTFVGKNAPKSLVDLTGSIEIAYNKLENLINEGEQMNLEEFKATEEYSAILAEKDQAVKAETARCLSILRIEGDHFDVKMSAIENGSQVNDVYANLYKAELNAKKTETSRLETVTEPAKVETVAPVKVKSGVTAEDFKTLVASKEAEGMKKSAAMLAARRESPEGFDAYINENQ